MKKLTLCLTFLTFSLVGCQDFTYSNGYYPSHNYYSPRKSEFNRTPSGPEFEFDTCLKLVKEESQANAIGMSIFNLDHCKHILENPPKSRKGIYNVR